jgi:hypothetical protein
MKRHGASASLCSSTYTCRRAVFTLTRARACRRRPPPSPPQRGLPGREKVHGVRQDRRGAAGPYYRQLVGGRQPKPVRSKQQHIVRLHMRRWEGTGSVRPYRRGRCRWYAAAAPTAHTSTARSANSVRTCAASGASARPLTPHHAAARLTGRAALTAPQPARARPACCAQTRLRAVRPACQAGRQQKYFSAIACAHSAAWPRAHSLLPANSVPPSPERRLGTRPRQPLPYHAWEAPRAKPRAPPEKPLRACSRGTGSPSGSVMHSSKPSSAQR